MNSQAELAKALRMALELGAVCLADVIEWSDLVIAEEHEPSIDFINLSLSKKTSDAISSLNLLSTGAKEELSCKLLFGFIYEGLRNGNCKPEPVAKGLYFWLAYETGLQSYDELYGFWDELDLAISGQYLDVEEVENRLLVFLQENMIEKPY